MKWTLLKAFWLACLIVFATGYFFLLYGTEAHSNLQRETCSPRNLGAPIHPFAVFSCVITYVPAGKEASLGQLAIEAIASFMETRLPGAPLTVVDDASSEAFIEKLKEMRLKTRFQIYRRRENGGSAMAKNSCLRLFSESNAMYLFLFEQDIVFQRKQWQTDYIRLGNDLNAHHMSWIGEKWLRNVHGQTSIVAGKYESQSGIPYLIAVTYTGQLSYLTRVAVSRLGGMIILPKRWGYAHVAYTQRAIRLGVSKELYDVRDGDAILTVAGEAASVYSKKSKEEAAKINYEFIQKHKVSDFMGYRPFIEYEEDLHLQPEAMRLTLS